MSQENVDLVHRAFDAINRRDLDAHLALMDEDVEGVPRAGLMEGSYRGHDGIRRWWKDLFGVFPDFAIEVVEVRDLGELTIATLHVRGQGAGSGIPSDDTVWSVARSQRGRCIWWANFDTQAEALEAAGLSEPAIVQQNVEVVHAALRAFADRDWEAWINCFHPDVEMLWPRNVLEGGSYQGHDGLRRALADAFETWEDFHFDLEDTRAVDDFVVALGHTTNVGKGDAPAVEYQSAYLFKLREKMISYSRPYQSHREALEAVGLSE